ncbi:unnamed protein product [Moneuplotes crassus]|uniref:Uncharacterized protein n=1 Tax=Euplotes crassus TaxID=5936 RepID=A0AAD2CYC6_EUPCR|nr:unnamed protein product [Moneuplotes crassus]
MVSELSGLIKTEIISDFPDFKLATDFIAVISSFDFCKTSSAFLSKLPLNKIILPNILLYCSLWT